MKIKIDNREHELLKHIKELIIKNEPFKDLEVLVDNLPLGDIIISNDTENKLIIESDIKHVIYSSLTIPKNFYNKFIDYLDSVMGDKSKLAINSMIGCFKPKERENWRSLLILLILMLHILIF